MPTIKDMAKGATMHGAEMIVKDAKYIPADKLDFCPMGCAKTAAAILREIAVVNMLFARVITGSEKDTEFGAKVEQASDVETLSALIMESAQVVCGAIDLVSEDDLDKDVPMPWGGSFPMHTTIFLPSSHMSYHDGQINYIQTLLGDSAFHWIE